MATQGKDTSPLSLSSAISVNGAGYEIGELTYGQLACRHCTGQAVQLRGDGIRKEYAFRNGVCWSISPTASPGQGPRLSGSFAPSR